jgi:predicted transcriptional regulator YdeE
MELYNIDTDIKLMYLQATKFPEDVVDAFNKLESTITNKNKRKFFGYSHPNNVGIIQYKACAAIIEETEPDLYGLQTITIKSGKYASVYIKNHIDNASSIPNAFEKLLKHPQLNPNGYCLEIYENFNAPDLLCLVPIINIK